MESIGSYEIRSEIGRGGMGIAYRAGHPQTRREVALKVLLEERLSTDEAAIRAGLTDRSVLERPEFQLLKDHPRFRARAGE